MAQRLLVIVISFALLGAACSSEAAPTTTLATTTTTTTTLPPTTTTTTEPPTTTTFTIPYAALDVSIEGDESASSVVQALYSWFGDRTLPVPDVPQGLLDHLAMAYADSHGSFTGEIFSEEIEGMGTAAVAVVNDQDIMLLVDDLETEDEEDTGWRLVGAWFAQFDVDPWFGDPLRYVFVIGTDARPGEDQQHFRADRLHILASNVVERSGGILGIPRDTYVQASYGGDKFTNVNALVWSLSDNTIPGQDEMVDLAAEMSGLPIEGYFITGFLNFQRLVDAFGGVAVDVPYGMAEPKSEAYLSAGLQTLFGRNALAFSRNRTIPGGDFSTQFHGGLVILAALDGVLERNITMLPALLATLMQFTWTDLSLEDLLTVAAGGFLLDADLVGNDVLPGEVTTRGGASVVDLTAGAEDMFRDMDDGSLSKRVDE
jgi:LCP family protein required for cell wall assembly